MTTVEIIQSANIWQSAVWGFAGTLVGALATLLGVVIKHHLDTAQQRKDDEERRSLLKQMLDNPAHEWRDIETLSRVIGASKDDTARLLIQLGARGSELERGVWALLSKKPLP